MSRMTINNDKVQRNEDKKKYNDLRDRSLFMAGEGAVNFQNKYVEKKSSSPWK